MQEFIVKLSSDPKNIMILIFFALDVLQIFVCLWFLLRAKNFIKNSVKTNAKIVNIAKVRSGKSIYTELSIVFKDELGVEVSQKINAHGAKGNIGDMVEILYSKNDSKIVKINNLIALYKSVIAAAFSLFFLFVASTIIYINIDVLS